MQDLELVEDINEKLAALNVRLKTVKNLQNLSPDQFKCSVPDCPGKVVVTTNFFEYIFDPETKELVVGGGGLQLNCLLHKYLSTRQMQ